MKKKSTKFAFYGKGGIGKSTIAANISGALAMCGAKVLHIGCDPKADSTRGLMGYRIPSVLSKLNQKSEITREDILFQGTFGVYCIETGGPEPGMGCAGLGITLMMEAMERLKIFEDDWDYICYDVLGDVVCGGFSVPMRNHYVDKVYIVTSSDYMALYAANNIMKAVQKYSSADNCLMGGLIHNHYKNNIDKEIVNTFAKNSNTCVIGKVEESYDIKSSDFKGSLLLKDSNNTESAKSIKQLSSVIKDAKDLPVPSPLNDYELDIFCKNIHMKGLI
ncbi:MAG: nitrogenase iron protein NifH [Clostridiales bacterium]